MRIRNLVPGLAAFRLRDDDAAITQAGQVVGNVRAAQAQVAGEYGRVAGLSSKVMRMRERVGSAIARPSLFITSSRVVMVSMR